MEASLLPLLDLGMSEIDWGQYLRVLKWIFRTDRAVLVEDGAPRRRVGL